ncbi:MAG: GTP 3',8-cyclase MoaA [Myxococcota bacterium]
MAPPPPDAPAAAVSDSLGRPLRDLRISVTDRCNFRCGYCMPEELYGERYPFLPKPEILSFEEIDRLVRIAVSLGVAKLRITGGEPLLRQDLPHLVARLAAIPGLDDLALTTNGSLLPRWAGALSDAGLRRVTVSLDSLDPDVFLRMNGGRMGVDRVLEGIEAARRAGLAPLKLNCVVQKGVNDDGLVDLARFARDAGHIVRFIEFMDVGTKNRWDPTHVLEASEIVARIDAELPLEPAEPNYRGEVARRWRYRDGGGEIGVIASVTQPFCGDCTRARLTTDGQLVTCLFASGGTSLRDPMRAGASDDALRALLERVWSDRRDRYSEERGGLLQVEDPDTQSGTGRVEMYQIGG